MENVRNSAMPARARASVETRGPDAEHAWRAHALKVILLTVFGVLAAYFAIGVPFVFANKLGAVVVLAMLTGSVACAWGCLRSGRITLGTHVLVWSLWVYCVGLGLTSAYPSAIWFTPTVVIAATLLGPLWAIAAGVTGIALIAVAIYAVELGLHLPRIFPAPPESQLFQFAGVLVVTAAPLYLVMRRMTAALRRAGEELAQRTRTQQELEQSEQRLMLALEAAHTGIYEWDITSGTLTGTPQAVMLFGLQQGEFGGTYEDFLRLVHPEDAERVADFNRGVLEGRLRGRAIEHRVILRDGSVRWIEGRGTLQRDAGGRPASVIGTVVDVTPRKLAELAMQEGETRYRAMIATMAAGTILRDMEGNLVLCNPAAERILGVKAGEMGRWSFPLEGWRTIHEDGSPFPRDEHPVMITLRTGQPCAAVVMGIQRGDGPLTWISINSTALERDNEDQPYAVLTTFVDITERKNAEKQLADSERRYRTILETLVEGVVMRDPQREVLIANPAAERVLGVPPKRLQYETLRERGWRTCREDGTPFPEREFPFEIALRTGKPVFNVVMGIRRPDEPLSWLSINAQPVFEPGSTAPYAVVVSHTDITERKNAQLMLDRERTMLRTLIDVLPDDVFVIDTAGRYTMVNSAWLALLGLAAEADAVGRTVYDFFDAERAARFAAENQRVIDSGIGLYNQSRALKTPKGGERWVLTSKIPMRDGRGRVVGILGINRDVSELKTALDTLRQERNLLRSIIDGAPDAIYVKDRECRYVVMNEAGLRMRELSAPADIIGKTARDFFPADVAAVIEAEDREVMNSARAIVNSERRSRELRAKGRWISISKIPLHDATGAVVGLVTINRDISEMKSMIAEVSKLNLQLEDRVRARTQELQEANRELEAFSYSVSHDLRAPLRSIAGFGNFLLKDNFKQLDAAGKERLQRILAASQRMGELIDDLLMLARISRQAMTLRKVRLHVLAAEVVAALREASPQRRVEVVIAPDLTVEADAGLMRVVMDNLLGNAWKFTARRADARIEVGADDRDGKRVYYVRDNGAGFDMSYAGKLFTPFQRMHTQQQFEGTGIGLATVRRIIERHQGRIWIESEDGRGTTVFFTLGGAA